MNSATSAYLSNKRHKADIALFCAILIATMLFSQLFIGSLVVHADDFTDKEFWIRNGKDVVGQLIITAVGGAILKWGANYLTAAVVMQVGSLIILGGIAAVTVVGVVVVVSNVVKSYSVENTATGCRLTQGGKYWECPYKLSTI